MSLIRATTPTVVISFSDISVANIQHAYLCIKQQDVAVIQRDISTAVVGSSSLSWKLTQAETLLLSAGYAQIYCDWILLDGTRGRSEIVTEKVESSGMNEVLPNAG